MKYSRYPSKYPIRRPKSVIRRPQGRGMALVISHTEKFDIWTILRFKSNCPTTSPSPLLALSPLLSSPTLPPLPLFQIYVLFFISPFLSVKKISAPNCSEIFFYNFFSSPSLVDCWSHLFIQASMANTIAS